MIVNPFHWTVVRCYFDHTRAHAGDTKMARHHRSYSIQFKRQVVQEYLSGDESLHGLAKRHQINRNLIRIWVSKYEAGDLSDEAVIAASIDEYEARIEALERKVGQLTMENDFLKKTLPPSALKNGVNSLIVKDPKDSVAHKAVD